MSSQSTLIAISVLSSLILFPVLRRPDLLAPMPPRELRLARSAYSISTLLSLLSFVFYQISYTRNAFALSHLSLSFIMLTEVSILEYELCIRCDKD